MEQQRQAQLGAWVVDIETLLGELDVLRYVRVDVSQVESELCGFRSELLAEEVPAKERLKHIVRSLDEYRSWAMCMFVAEIFGPKTLDTDETYVDSLGEVDMRRMRSLHKLSDSQAKRRAWMSVSNGDRSRHK